MAESNMEKFAYGQFSPTEEEIKKAREQGPEAVKALEEKMKKATANLRMKQSEKAVESLENQAKKEL